MPQAIVDLLKSSRSMNMSANWDLARRASSIAFRVLHQHQPVPAGRSVIMVGQVGELLLPA